jgi:hypothetical protein
VDRDGLGDQLLDPYTAPTDSDAAWKVRHVSTPGVSLVLDGYDVLSDDTSTS